MAGYADQLRMRGPSLVEIAQLSGLTRTQREQRDAQERAEKRQFERDTLADDQMRFNREQMLAERQQARADYELKIGEAQAKKAAEAEQAKSLGTANRERHYARLYRANAGNPEALERISAGARAQGIDLGTAQPMQVQIAGGPAREANWNPDDLLAAQPPEQIRATPSDPELAAQEAASRAPQIAEELDARAAGLLGPQKMDEQRRADPFTEIGKRVLDKYGLRQGDQGYDQAFAEIESALTAEKAAEQKSKQAGTAADLRKEFQALPTVRNMGTIAESYERIVGAPASGVGDMALIFGLMKMQDPNSSVREGEYANAENAGGAFSKYGNLYNKILKGAVLTDELRGKFKSEGGRFYSAQRRLYEAEAENYREHAAGLGFDPAHVVFDRFERGAAKDPETTPQGRRQIIAQMNAMVDQLKRTGVPEGQAKQMALSKFRAGGR